MKLTKAQELFIYQLSVSYDQAFFSLSTKRNLNASMRYNYLVFSVAAKALWVLKDGHLRLLSPEINDDSPMNKVRWSRDQTPHANNAKKTIDKKRFNIPWLHCSTLSHLGFISTVWNRHKTSVILFGHWNNALLSNLPHRRFFLK